MAPGATIIDDWIAEGESRGRETEARQMALRLLRKRFGDLPLSLVERVERLEVAECEALAERLIDGVALEQLFSI